VTARFVDIGGIVDHHCFKLSFQKYTGLFTNYVTI